MSEMEFPGETTGEDGFVAADRLGHVLRITRGKLALALGLSRDAVSKTARARAPATQLRLHEMVEIVNRVRPWAGSPQQAFA